MIQKKGRVYMAQNETKKVEKKNVNPYIKITAKEIEEWYNDKATDEEVKLFEEACVKRVFPKVREYKYLPNGSIRMRYTTSKKTGEKVQIPEYSLVEDRTKDPVEQYDLYKAREWYGKNVLHLQETNSKSEKELSAIERMRANRAKKKNKTNKPAEEK